MERQARKTGLTKNLNAYSQRLRLCRTLYVVGAVCVGIGLWVGYLAVTGWLYTSELFSSRVPVVQPKYGDSLFRFLSKEEAARRPLRVLGVASILTMIGFATFSFGVKLDAEKND